MSQHRVVISSLYLGQLCQNVLHFDNPDGATQPQAIAQDVFDNWIMKVTIHTGSAVNYFNVLVQNLSNPNEAPFSLAVNRSGQSFAANTMGPFTCKVFKFLTARAGRHGRGRCFIPGIDAQHITLGQLNSGYITNVNSQVITPIMARFGPGGTSNLNLCVRENDGTDVGIFNPVISIQCRAQLGVQRRRNIGIGV